MMPKPYNRRIKHDLLEEYNNEEEFTCDGLTINYSGGLPDMDFAANLLSEQNKYYSQAIINTALAGSIIWVKTHHQKLQTIKEKTNKYLNAKKEDRITLPCPKTNKNILIPLKIQLKIPLDQTMLDKETFFLVFEKVTRNRLLKNNILAEKDTQYVVRQPSKFKIYLKRNYKYEWTEINWLDKKWSVSIEKRSSLDYNAMLSIKILVDQSELGKRTFIASLRLNPSSKNLHNIDLFKTNIAELDKGTDIGKILLTKLFEANLLTYFDKKRATHLEDFQEASKPYEAYKTTYLTISHSNIQRLIPNLRPKLGIVAYTIDLTTRNYVDILIPKLTAIFRNRLFKIYDSIKDINKKLDKMEEINVSTHRFALGFNINNYKDKYTITIYAKDLHQHLSKIKRLSSHEKMKELPVTKVRHLEELKEIETDRHKLRLEITIRGWKEIHTKAYYHYLDKIKRLIQQVDLKLTNLDTNGKTRAENIQEIEEEANKELDKIETEAEEELGHSNGLTRSKNEIKIDESDKQTKLIDFG